MASSLEHPGPPVIHSTRGSSERLADRASKNIRNISAAYVRLICGRAACLSTAAAAAHTGSAASAHEASRLSVYASCEGADEQPAASTTGMHASACCSTKLRSGRHMHMAGQALPRRTWKYPENCSGAPCTSRGSPSACPRAARKSSGFITKRDALAAALHAAAPASARQSITSAVFAITCAAQGLSWQGSAHTAPLCCLAICRLLRRVARLYSALGPRGAYSERA